MDLPRDWIDYQARIIRVLPCTPPSSRHGRFDPSREGHPRVLPGKEHVENLAVVKAKMFISPIRKIFGLFQEGAPGHSAVGRRLLDAKPRGFDDTPVFKFDAFHNRPSLIPEGDLPEASNQLQ